MKVNYPQTILIKSDGSTAAEAYLSRLCNDTFLSLWSYPNVFRDQGRTNACRTEAKGDGKELCDLLVVCDNHIIIFSDKNCAFPNNGDLQTDWSRWYKKAVHHAAEQIWGAERWINRFPTLLYLDNNCTVPFPLEIPPPEKAIFHRIVVAHGISEICKKHLGGSGSLMICPDIVGEMHVKRQNHPCNPFALGKVDMDKGYVHIFDDTSLEIVMRTLDTITDFIQYLTKKEALINSGRLVAAAGEEDLLAYYLKNIDSNNEHTFFPEGAEQFTAIVVDEGIWNAFSKHPSRLAQIKANEISYSWDKLIETFIFHVTHGTSYIMSHPSIKKQEEAFRFLAKENRTRRRLLATHLHEFIKNTPENSRGTRVILPSFSGESHYLFLLLPRVKNISDDVYRKTRGQLLENYLIILKLNFPNAAHIIGLATETGFADERSEDFIYLDASEWTEEENEEAKKIEQEFIDKGLLGKRKMYSTSIQEYPDIEPENRTVEMSGKDRNQPCPCNSGKKFKKCCGKVKWN